MPIRRRNPSVATVPPKPRVPQQWADKRVLEIDQIIRRHEYDIIGNLSFVNIAVNQEMRLIDFRKGGGPAVARARTMDALILVTPWQGIPDKTERTEDFCPTCITDCDICQGIGKKLCEAPFCGGEGIQHLPATHHEGKCHNCPKCVACNGTGKSTCSSCRGKGRRATGQVDGKLCGTCAGAQFVIRKTPVNVMDFCLANVGAGIALGPIIKFTVRPIGESRNNSVRAYDVSPDFEQMPMILLLRSKTIPCQCYLIGGIAREATR